MAELIFNLQSNGFERRSPKIICVEAAEYSPIGAGARRNELIDFLFQKIMNTQILTLTLSWSEKIFGLFKYVN